MISAVDLLHAEGPALDVLAVLLVQPDGRVLVSTAKHRHLEGIVAVGVVFGKLVSDSVALFLSQVRVHLHDPGDHGPILIELPAVLLGGALRADGLPGQIQKAPAPDAVIALKKQEAQLIPREGPELSVHAVIVVILPRCLVLPDGAAVRREGDAL